MGPAMQNMNELLERDAATKRVARQAGQRMAFGEYLRIAAVNVSSLLHMRTSPKHYRHYLEHGRADTDTYRIGRATHTAILENEQFLRDYCMWNRDQRDAFEELLVSTGSKKPARTRTPSPKPAGAEREPARTGAAWDAFQAANAKRTILTQAQYDLAIAMRDAVRGHRRARHYLEQPGQREVTFTFTHPMTGLPCKLRIDWLCSAIIDIKTAADGEPEAFGRNAGSLAYHVRAAFYQDGLYEATGERLPVKLIAVEKRAPHDVVVHNVRDDDIAAGRGQYEALLGRVLECRRTDVWPGIAEDDELELQIKPWHRSPGGDGDGLDLVIDGAPVAI